MGLNTFDNSMFDGLDREDSPVEKPVEKKKDEKKPSGTVSSAGSVKTQPTGGSKPFRIELKRTSYSETPPAQLPVVAPKTITEQQKQNIQRFVDNAPKVPVTPPSQQATEEEVRTKIREGEYQKAAEEVGGGGKRVGVEGQPLLTPTEIFTSPVGLYESAQREYKSSFDKLSELDNKYKKAEASWKSSNPFWKGQKDKVESDKPWMTPQEKAEYKSIEQQYKQNKINAERQRYEVSGTIKSDVDKTLMSGAGKVDFSKEGIVESGNKSYSGSLYFSKEGEYMRVPDADKIDAEAKRIAKKYGMPDDGYFYQDVKNQLTGAVNAGLSQPKIEEEANRLFKNKTGKTIAEYISSLDEKNKSEFEKAVKSNKELSSAVAKADSTARALQQSIVEKSKLEYEKQDADYNIRVEEIKNSVSNDENFRSVINSLEEKEYQRINAEVQAGRMTYDQAVAYVGSEAYSNAIMNNPLVKQAYEAIATPQFKQAYDDYLLQRKGLNARINSRYNRQINEINAQLKSDVDRISQEIAKTFKGAEVDRAFLERIYTDAARTVQASKEAKVESIHQSKGMFENFYNQAMMSMGGALKNYGFAFDNDRMRLFGEDLENTYFTTKSPEFNSFADYLDGTKVALAGGNFIGRMAPGRIAAGAATALTATGFGSPVAAAIVGGMVSFGSETIDMSNGMYLDIYAETGDPVKASAAAGKVVEGQMRLMALYSLEMLPFIKIPVKGFGKKIAVGAVSETGTELIQEIYQGGNEKFIREQLLSKNVDPLNLQLTNDFKFEDIKHTAMNIVPMRIAFGGGSQTVSASFEKLGEFRTKRAAQEFAAKVDLSDISTSNVSQFMYGVYSKKGEAFTTAMADVLLANDAIDENTRQQMLNRIEQFKELEGIYSSMNIPKEDILTRMAGLRTYEQMMNAQEAVRMEMERNGGVSTPVTIAMEKALAKAEKAFSGVLSRENPEMVVMTMPSGETYLYTPEEALAALDKENIKKMVAEGSIALNVLGSSSNKVYAPVMSAVEQILKTTEAPKESWRAKTEADIQSDKEVMVKEEIEVQDIVPTVEEAVNSKKTYTYQDQTGSLYVEGDMVIFESPNKKVEIGEIDKVGESNVTELGLKPEVALEVAVGDDNSITVEGKKYVNNYSDPMAAVSVDKDGNYSVSLETEDGKKRTFRKGRAEAIVYQMKLKQLDNATEQQIDEISRLADQALSAEGQAEQVAAEAAPEVTGEAQAVETAKAPAESGAVTPTQQQDAVQVETAGQVPVQPEARVGQEVAQGKPQAEPQAVAQEGKPQEVTVKTEKPKGKWTPSETIKKLKERQKKFAGNNVDKAVESINKSLESSNVKAEVIESQAEWNKVTGGQGRGNNGIFISQDGSGKIYINRQKLQEGFGTTVVWHEGTHPVINIIRNTNKPLYDKMVKGLTKARKSATGNTKSGLNQILNWVENEYAQDGEFTIEDESIVEVIAMIADGKLKLDEMPKSIAQTIIDFINSMAEFFGLPTVLPDTDMRTFMNTANAISEALITGKDMASIVGAENVGKFEFIKPGGQSRRVSTEQVFKREEVKKGKKKVMDVAKEFEKAVDDVIEPAADADTKMTRFLTNAYEDLRYFLSDFEGDVGLDWYTNKMREFDEKLMEASDIAIERGDMPAENSLRDPDNMDLFKAVLALSSTGENPKSNTRAAFNIWKNFNRGEMLFQKYQPGQVSLRTKVEIKTAKGEPKIDKKTGKVMYEAPSGPIIRENKRTVTIQVGNKEVTIKKSELRPAYQMEYNVTDAKGKTVVKTPEKEMRVWKETDKYFYFGTPSSKGGLLKIAKSDILMMEPVDNGITGKGWTARGGAVAANLEKLEMLMQDHGGIVGAVQWLKSKHGIEELRKYNAGVPDVNGKKGMNPEGERYGSFIFGEKLGPFHQNVSGVPTELTMDLWWSRTWNRYMGTLITKGTNEKVDIQEVPRNDAERNIMREAARLAADDLGLEVHELQAALWYMEQQMYKRMGAAVESYSFVDGINEILKNYGKKDEELRSENYGVDSTEADRKRQDAVSKLNTRLYGEGVKIRKAEGGRVEVQREDGGVEIQPSKAAERSTPVYFDGAPKGTFINVGLKEGVTNKTMSVSDVKSKLPSDVKVIESTRLQGTEPTVSMKISRKLTDAEMNTFLNDTKQLAIPQLSDGEGKIHGSKEWGDFNGDFFMLPNGKRLSDVATVKTSNKYGNEIYKQESKAGNRIFNQPIADVSKIADGYYQGVFGKERPKYTGSRKIDKERAKRIADAFINMKHDPTNKEVAAAYAKLAEETILQYQAMIDAGYVIEVNNNEPYANSADMISDLANNKRIKIFSTESGFGDTPITDQQRSENPLLQRTKFVDVNGVPLLVNDLFRAVHDFFGHAELGNSFGPIGEENAWNVHARMFSPLARKAMTTETRGQNSFVNFSGVNEKIEGLRQQARELREQGLEQEAQAIVDQIYTEGSFADQKVGLLPEEFYSIDETDTGDGEVFKPSVEGQRSSSAERYGSREEMFETHKLYVELATEAINAGVETYQEFLDGLDEVKTALSENAWRDAKRIAQGKKPMINGPEDINRGMKKSLANRAFEGGSQETVKDAIYEFGLDYDPISNESAYESASQFIDKVGIDDALIAANNGMISGSMQAFVYSIAIDRVGAEMAVETDPVRQMELISKQASIINAFDMKARDGGRFVQALNYVYKNSDFPYTYEYAIKSLVEANAGKELTTEMKGMINSLVSQIGDLTKRIKEQETKLQEAMERDAVAKIVEAVVNEKKTSKEKSSYQKVADKIREGKINRPGMFMASSPAAVAWDAALETAATIIEAGGKLADAVAEGIMRMKQSEWYKSADEKTRKDGEKVFTDYMVESSSKENLKAPVKPTVDTDGNINIPFSFLRQLVKDGVTTIEEMTSVILDTLSIDYEGITERQVRDAITKYGQQKFPSKDEVLRKLAEMKRDGQLLSALEDVESGKFPAKSGFQREKPTDKQRELTRKIKDRMKDIPEDQEQIEKNWASAQTRIKTILENRIADLNAQIAAGQRDTRNRKQTDLNEENKLLKAEVARLNEVLDGLVGKVEVSHETKVKNALKAIERAKDDIQDMIAKSNIGYQEKKAKLEDPRITAAREQLDAMRETLNQMREEQGIAEARRIAMYKERLKQDIKEMQRKLDEGDYAKKESKDMSMIDDEVKRMRAEKLKLKNKIDIEKEKLRIQNRTIIEKSLDTVVDIVNIPRSMLASMDLSAPLRQGLIMSLRNPGIASAAFAESLRFATSKVSFERYMEALESSPEYMVMKEAGLFLSTPSAELAAREEQFLSNLAEKIPVYGTILIAGTQRAYTGYLNKIRADVFMAFHKQLLDEGYTGAELMDNLKSFAQFINEASGRGTFGKRGDAILGNTSQLLFAPRYVASRFNVLARTASLGYGMPKAARKEMLKTMGVYLGLGSLALIMAAAAGAEVEDDPRSSDFGKIKIGDLRFDIWAGNQQIVVLLSRILTMETKRTGTGEIVPFYSGGWNSQTIMSTLGDFLENKVSPPVAIFMDFDSKDNTFKYDKKFFGMELAKKGEEFNITDAILGNLSPIWLNDIGEINREQGLPSAVGAGLGSFFGLGVSYYGPSVKDKVQNDVYQYFNENPPGDWSSQKYMKEYRSFIKDSIIPKYKADPDFNDDILSDAERTADVLHATNGKPTWYRDAFYASTNDTRLKIILSNTQGMSKKELEKTVDELYELGIVSDEFYSERIDPLLEK